MLLMPLTSTTATPSFAADPEVPLFRKLVKFDLPAVESAVARTEARINLWLDTVPNPPIEQLGIASLALWRVAAVHKTLYLIRTGKYSTKHVLPMPKEFLKSIRVMEEAVKLLHIPPPKPPKPKSPPSGAEPNPFAPYRVGLPPLHLASREPKPAPEFGPLTDSALCAPSEKAHWAFETALESPAPRKVVACPELANPDRTIQAAERQANDLCKEAGLPDPDSTPEAPAPTPETASASPENPASTPGHLILAPETASTSPETSAIAPAPASANGPSRGRRELPPAKRSAAGGDEPINPRPGAGARFHTPNHPQNPP